MDKSVTRKCGKCLVAITIYQLAELMNVPGALVKIFAAVRYFLSSTYSEL